MSDVGQDAFDNNAKQASNIESFEDMSLGDSLLRGIFAYGFEKPAQIQAKAIPMVIKGQDIIVQSQAGSGKTGAFVIGALSILDENKRCCQAIIVSPTHELATQTYTVATAIAQHMRPFCVGLCIGGGADISLRTISNIKKGNPPQLLIGTPGKISFLLESGILPPSGIKVLILDEADCLLSFPLVQQIKRIIERTPKNAQICLFSATISQEVLDVTKLFLHDPKTILVDKEELTLSGVTQFYVAIGEEDWKLPTLCDIYGKISITQSIIYVNRKRKAIWLRNSMQNKSFTVSVITGDMETSERSSVMDDFRTGKSRVLISTDLLARGIDIQQVSIVLNYDLPQDAEHYIHRVGRSGRFGRKGISISFVTKRDESLLHEIEKHFNTRVEEMPENISEYL